MPQYRIYKSRFVQQVGQDYPVYVYADAENPTVIELPELDPITGGPYKVDSGLHPVDEPVKVFKPHYAKQDGHGGVKVQTAAEAHGKKSGRASDRTPVP